MEGIVGLETIAELSVTLAGFSALVAVFRGGAIHSWHPRARLGFWLIIAFSFGAVFFSLLPSVFSSLGTASWGAPISTLSAFLLAVTALGVRRNLQLLWAGIPAPSQTPWIVGTLVQVAVVAWLVYGVAGGRGGPTYELYLLGVINIFLMACFSFVVVLRLPAPAA